MDKLKGWHSRGYLPHFDGGTVAQFITFSLKDAFPTVKLREWEAELGLLSHEDRVIERIRRIEEYLDCGHGEAWLREPQVADSVENSILYFDTLRYQLHAWVVMPNHVHLLFTPLAGFSLSKIMKSLKEYTAKEANRILGREGQFWQEDYFDRYIRNEQHYANTLAYIEYNPMAARLCERPEDWPCSSAALRLKYAGF